MGYELNYSTLGRLQRIM